MEADFRDAGEVSDVDTGHEHPAAGEDLDELFLRELPQRLPYRCASEPEPPHQFPLVDHRPRRELE